MKPVNGAEFQRKRVPVMTRQELTEEVLGLKRVLEEVLKACEANIEGTKPTEMKVNTMRAELDARFKGLDARLMKLEGRS